MIKIKDIKGYEGLYWVSEQGKVYSEIRNIFLKTQTQKYGYETVKLYKNGLFKRRQVHRLVAEALLPNPDNKRDVTHKNRVVNDNRLENLEWTDRRKLSFKIAEEIRTRFHLGQTVPSLAKRFKVNPFTITQVINKVSYKKGKA